MKILTYIGTFANLTVEQMNDIARHGGQIKTSGEEIWQVEFYRPIMPATAMKMVDDLLRRGQLIQQVEGEIEVPDDGTLNLSNSGELTMSTPGDPFVYAEVQVTVPEPSPADQLRLIADQLLAPPLHTSVPVHNGPRGPIVGELDLATNQVTIVDEEFARMLRGGLAGYSIRPAGAEATIDPIEPAEVRETTIDAVFGKAAYDMLRERFDGVLDKVWTELQSADHSTTKDEYVKHLRAIAAVVKPEIRNRRP